MVELQSCASLVSASALCAIQQEVKGEGVNVIAEITAELQRERRKNAELMERISILEAQIQQRNKDSLPADGRSSCPNAMERSFKKLKRQKTDTANDGTENGNINKSEMSLQKTHDPQCFPPKDANLEEHLVNWMSMDDTQFLHFEKFKDSDLAADFDDTDDSDDEDDDYRDEDDINGDHKVRVATESSRIVNELREYLPEGVDFDGRSHMQCLESCSVGQSEPTFSVVNWEMNENRKEIVLVPDTKPVYDEKELKKLDRKETKKVGEDKAPPRILTFDKEVCHPGPGSLSLHKKPPKTAFCPKEVKRIIESDILFQKNAQSHTIRKIIVFASLGIRHGCEDMYELNFNHFSILRKGEPFISPKDPGEHVLYENPGVRRKVFYPNRQNPTLCPVQILEEEKAMRPSDTSCPSCLFLCIKYGGRTRNLPQNEYVRQRMGRNKLKSFGPLMCRMAMLVHIRSGSFFFKALGITLLFMAGFPDDLVQRETKYRNLDLLQKYYRTDEDAEGEELFLPYLVTSDTLANPGSQQLTGKTTSTKSRGRKQTSSNAKPNNLVRSSVQQSTPSSSATPAHFGLMGYTSIHNHAMAMAAAAFQSMPPQTSPDAPPISNPVVPGTATNVSYHNQTPFHVFPQQPANAFLPMMYWPPPNTFPPGPFPSTYGFQSFPSAANYMSIHQQPYYSHTSSNPFIPKTVGGTQNNGKTLEEADSDSDSSSSSTDPKER